MNIYYHILNNFKHCMIGFAPEFFQAVISNGEEVMCHDCICVNLKKMQEHGLIIGKHIYCIR